MICPEVIIMKERLKQIRKATGLNQTDFASRIHMKQTSYSQLETGSSPIRESHIDLICNAFNIDRTWFLTGEGEMIARKSESNIDALVKRFSFPEICAKLLYAYDGLDEARRAQLTFLILCTVSGVAAGLQNTG